MKSVSIAFLAIAMMLGLALADFGGYGAGYGSGSYGSGYGQGYTLVPVTGGYGGGYGAGGFGQGGFLMLIGLLFILFFLFNNNNTNTVVPNITIGG